MGQEIKMNRATVRKALKVLVACRLIYQVRPGAYRWNPPEAWVCEDEVEMIRNRIDADRKAAKTRGGFRVLTGEKRSAGG
jgi:hypothetical protein